jgi:hypothetical protein
MSNQPFKLLTNWIGDSGATRYAHSADEYVLGNTGQLHSLLLLLCHTGAHASQLLTVLLHVVHFYSEREQKRFDLNV